VTVDAGYENQQNYTYLEERGIEAFVKYNYFHKEQKQYNKLPNSFDPDQLHYNLEKDCYYCPMGQQMNNIGIYKKKTKNGHLQTYTKYQASNCSECP